MYGQGPFIPMPVQQTQAYEPPADQGDEWYETLFKALPLIGTAYDLGDKIFGSKGDEEEEEKKKEGEGDAAEDVASALGAAGNIYSWFA